MPATRDVTDVAIVGAGIGGLAAALSLHRHGRMVAVFEQADAVRELGVGINVLPPAVSVLAELGLLGDLDKAAVRTGELIMATRRGDVVWREPRGLGAGHAVPQFSIHRGRLQGILATALRRRAGRDVIRVGHRLKSFRRDDKRVEATFVDRAGRARAVVTAAALVGADGIHSTVRNSFHPAEGAPRWNGLMLWRGDRRRPGRQVRRRSDRAGCRRRTPADELGGRRTDRRARQCTTPPGGLVPAGTAGGAGAARRPFS